MFMDRVLACSEFIPIDLASRTYVPEEFFKLVKFKPLASEILIKESSIALAVSPNETSNKLLVSIAFMAEFIWFPLNLISADDSFANAPMATPAFNVLNNLALELLRFNMELDALFPSLLRFVI